MTLGPSEINLRAEEIVAGLSLSGVDSMRLQAGSGEKQKITG